MESKKVGEGKMEVKEIERIMEKYDADRTDVLGMLMDIQEKERYLPREALRLSLIHIFSKKG